MSLRVFHVFFIGTSILLAVFVASWATYHAEWVIAFGAVAAGTLLVAYHEAFIMKADADGLH